MLYIGKLGPRIGSVDDQVRLEARTLPDAMALLLEHAAGKSLGPDDVYEGTCWIEDARGRVLDQLAVEITAFGLTVN